MTTAFRQNLIPSNHPTMDSSVNGPIAGGGGKTYVDRIKAIYGSDSKLTNLAASFVTTFVACFLLLLIVRPSIVCTRPKSPAGTPKFSFAWAIAISFAIAGGAGALAWFV